jgi:hypothetical protein
MPMTTDGFRENVAFLLQEQYLKSENHKELQPMLVYDEWDNSGVEAWAIRFLFMPKSFYSRLYHSFPPVSYNPRWEL